MKTDELMAQVSALHIQPGTVVVLSLNLDTPDNFETAKAMAEQLRHAIPHENKLLVLQRPAEIQALDEAQMRELGWVRQSVVDEVVSALESLILFTKPSKSNAVALNNAHAVIASAKGGEE